jgi:hypothetical protein
MRRIPFHLYYSSEPQLQCSSLVRLEDAFSPNVSLATQPSGLAVTGGFFVSLVAVGNSLRSILRGNNILLCQYPAFEVAEWARNATPKEAVFLIPIHDEGGWQCFRHLSQRNVFTHRKDGTAWTFAPWFADDWLERLAALGFFEVLGIDRKSFKIGSWIYIWSQDEKNFIRVYDKVDDDRVNKLQQRYRIDYWDHARRC